MVKGFLHIHTVISGDSSLPLANIKEIGLSKNFSFALLTEHYEKIKGIEQYIKYVQECKEISDESFLLVPGVEIAINKKLHILILNFLPKNWMRDKDWSSFFQSLNEDSICVLAHPNPPFIDLLREVEPYLKYLRGIEVWNRKYDGHFFPSSKKMKFYQNMLKKNGNLLFFAGLDAHSVEELFNIGIALDENTERLQNKQSIIKEIKKGNFTIVSDEVTYTSGGKIIRMKKRAKTMGILSRFIKVLLRFLKGLSLWLSFIYIPRFLKNHLRRLYNKL